MIIFHQVTVRNIIHSLRFICIFQNQRAHTHKRMKVLIYKNAFCCFTWKEQQWKQGHSGLLIGLSWDLFLGDHLWDESVFLGCTSLARPLILPTCLFCFFLMRGWRSFFYFLIYFLFLFMAVLGLRFCARAFSSCGKWGPLFITVHGPLTIVASLVAEHRLQTRRLSNCGSQA